MIDRLTFRDFEDRVFVDRSSFSLANGLAAVVVEGRESATIARRTGERYVDRAEIADLPVLIIGVGSSSEVFDLVVDGEDELSEVLEAIDRRPLASVATALLLRSADLRTVTAGLVAESTTFSLLQSGPEFQEWCAGRPRPGVSRDDSASPVLVDRLENSSESGDHLVITLHRPERRNAYSAAMRAALADALDVALVDHAISKVTLRGAGSNFSSGGDLDEFGSFTDPVTAHMTRLTSHVAASLWRLHRRLGTNLICEIHGDNFGAGVEVAAFAGRVVARPGTTFMLPEVRMGLTPGAGGTVSIPRRVGRHRALQFALTGRALDVETARAWGLVDEIHD